MRMAGAVDIGGTKIMTGIADEAGNILASQSFSTITGADGALRSTRIIADTLGRQCASLGLTLEALSGVGVRGAGKPRSAAWWTIAHVAGLGRLSNRGQFAADDGAGREAGERRQRRAAGGNLAARLKEERAF